MRQPIGSYRCSVVFADSEMDCETVKLANHFLRNLIDVAWMSYDLEINLEINNDSCHATPMRNWNVK